MTAKLLSVKNVTSLLRVAAAASISLPLLLLVDGRVPAQDAQQAPQEQGEKIKAGHPYIEQKDIKTETCLGCHPEMNQGKFIHAAVASGCDSCHQAASDKDTQKTTITLTATGADLCAMCHEATKDPVVHGPVKAGQCLSCHDPHASEFQAHTRADGNALCLACHSPRRTTGDTVTLFKSVSIPAQDFEAIPKIQLDPMMRLGHPWATHPVAEISNPLNPKEKMSCLSCHQPHSSSQQRLVIASVKGKDICDTCHQAFEEQKKAKLEQLNQAQIQQQDRQRQDALNKKQSGSQMAPPRLQTGEKQP